MSRPLNCAAARIPREHSRAAAAHPRTHSILLADEFALFRDGVASICNSCAGYRIAAECSDGRQALKSILSLRPDLAILQLNLPGLHSAEIIRKIRKARVETKSLVLSSRCDVRAARDNLDSGARGFLLKSDPAAILLEAMDRVLQGKLYVSPKLGWKQLSHPRQRGTSGDPLEDLSSRELQVLSLLVDGLPPKQIALNLDLNVKTVSTYRVSVMKKLKIHHLPGLVKFAIRHNLTRLA